MKVCIFYDHDQRRLAAPWSIGNALFRHFADEGHETSIYNARDIPIEDDFSRYDLIIGHPLDDCISGVEWAALQKTRSKSEYQRIYTIAPYNTVDHLQRMQSYVHLLDGCLLICGRYWYVRKGQFGGASTYRLDSFVDGTIDKHTGDIDENRGRFLYVGCAMPQKGVEQLARVAKLLEGRIQIHHLGAGYIPHTYPLGYIPRENDAFPQILRRYNYGIFLGRNDANCVAAMELAAAGVCPLCTKSTGWEEFAEFQTDTRDDRIADGLMHRSAASMGDIRCDRQYAATVACMYTRGRFLQQLDIALR